MKGMVVVATLLLIFSAKGYAQQNLLVTDEVIFRTNDSRDDIRGMRFGFGAKYSDTTDYDTDGRNLEYEELEIFGPPPGTFFVMFKRDCDGGFSGECRYNNIDIRGVPDSVGDDKKAFALTYKIELARAGAFGQEVTIEFPTALDKNIDSVNFRDLLNGSIFNHTFNRSGGSELIPNNFLNEMAMTVYYNLDPEVSSVRNRDDFVAMGSVVVPNPAVRSSGVLVMSDEPVSRVELVDVRGTVVQEFVSPEFYVARGGFPLSLEDVTAGIYFVVLYNRNGVQSNSGRLVVLQ